MYNQCMPIICFVVYIIIVPFCSMKKNLFVYVITMYNDYTISVSVPVTVTHFVHENIICVC